jgi:hypothetical protein
MNATRLGNLIASLIRKCDSYRSVASAHAFINSMFKLCGRLRMISVFDGMVCRLEQDGIILGFYLFYLKMEGQVLHLLSAVDREFQEIDGADLAILNDSNIRFLRSYYHIAEYLSLHADYWDQDIFFHLTTIAEREIGYANRLLWCSIGKEEVYDWATSNMPLGFQVLLANPANMVANDAVYSEEGLHTIMWTLMEQYPHSSAPGPASEEDIASLSRKDIDENMLGPELKAKCSVCLDNVKIGDEVVVLPCNHWYQEACATAWLKEHNTCPICRTGIEGKQAPPLPRRISQNPPIKCWVNTSRRLLKTNESQVAAWAPMGLDLRKKGVTRELVKTNEIKWQLEFR